MPGEASWMEGMNAFPNLSFDKAMKNKESKRESSLDDSFKLPDIFKNIVSRTDIILGIAIFLISCIILNVVKGDWNLHKI